ncbi:hypothetical protein [Xylophilus sp. GOD-11R]|uniref:hypothetical protein n=1 Tax=Xylophilus sp. GOD-11R TaxID=3089814 RepID=UPI00298BE992|nr:hypothetical protein [Xylophilus sp. GOD-11R]WPB55378.1 hypothetical protein R9X41_14645 [Xylophilus sp. GOD-11R]
MALQKQRHRIALSLGLVHLLLVVAAYFGQVEGSWGFYYFILPDFPVFLLLGLSTKLLTNGGTWLVLGVLGTLWWISIGMFAGCLIRKRAERSYL